MAERMGPFHDLAAVRAAAKVADFGTSVLMKAQELAGTETMAETKKVVRALLASLTAEDFFRSHMETYGNCDDYVKINEYGMWFVKLALKEDGKLAVHSCHESDKDLVILANGRTLEKP